MDVCAGGEPEREMPGGHATVRCQVRLPDNDGMIRDITISAKGTGDDQVECAVGEPDLRRGAVRCVVLLGALPPGATPVLCAIGSSEPDCSWAPAAAGRHGPVLSGKLGYTGTTRTPGARSTT
jgi:hypothetical protein